MHERKLFWGLCRYRAVSLKFHLNANDLIAHVTGTSGGCRRRLTAHCRVAKFSEHISGKKGETEKLNEESFRRSDGLHLEVETSPPPSSLTPTSPPIPSSSRSCEGANSTCPHAHSAPWGCIFTVVHKSV